MAGEPHVYPSYFAAEEDALPQAAKLAEQFALADTGWFFDGETLVVKLVLPEDSDSAALDVCRDEGCS